MDRRTFLKLSAATGGLFLTGLSPHLVFGKDPSQKNLLVWIFLNGGADPLTLFPPVEDPYYFSQRPHLAVPKTGTKALSGPFALHPALEELYPLWMDKQLAVVHNFGLIKTEHSHFAAQGQFEKGIVQGQEPPQDGCLSRALELAPEKSAEPLRSVVLQTDFPRVFQGGSNPAVIPAISYFQRREGNKLDLDALRKPYETTSDLDLKQKGILTFNIQKKLCSTFGDQFVRGSESEKPKDSLEFRLNEIARLTQANVGLRMAYTSSTNWDTHTDQARRMQPLMLDLARGLSKFRMSLQKSGHWKNTLVVIYTEFGRTVKQNGGLGSEHGQGSAAILAGGSLAKGMGGSIKHRWNSLKQEDLANGRELFAYHDYRDVFGEALGVQLGLTEEHLKTVFPGHKYQKLGLL